jgi:hypothetical protein
MKAFQIDTMHDDLMRHFQKTARAPAGGDDRIHTADEPFGERLVIALRRRGKHQPEFHTQNMTHENTGEHFDIAPRMPDPEAPLFGR